MLLMRLKIISVCAALLMSSAAYAGPWTLPSGTARVGLQFIHWQADERFVGIPNVGGKPGDRVDLGTDIAGAKLVHQQYALSLTYGITDTVQISAYMPIIVATFEDEVNGFETIGTGDPILGVDWRVAGPVTFGATLKIPVSEVPRDVELPLSEGQTDLTIWQRLGTSFGWHGWVQLDTGYRIRFAREDHLKGAGTLRRKPGNELTIQGGGGWRPGAPWGINEWAVTLGVDALFGSDGEDIDAADNALQLQRRELIELQPGILYSPIEGLDLTVGAGLPLAGMAYPAGPRLFAGVSYSVALIR